MKKLSLIAIVLIVGATLSSVSWARFSADSYFSRNQGAYWKTNEFGYSYTPSTSSFEVKTDSFKSSDAYKGSNTSIERKKIMDGSPNKWTPSEFPPKMPSR